MAKRHLLLGWILLQSLSVIAMDKDSLKQSLDKLRRSTEKLSKSREIQIPQSKKSNHGSSSSSSSFDYYHSPCGSSRNSWERKEDLKPLPPYQYHSDCP